MKVILLKDISNLGKRGDVKEVADSYAVNVLIKKQMAVMATQSELSKWKSKEDAKNHKKEIETNAFKRLIDALQKTEILIKDKKRDEKGQLFAAIHNTDIASSIYDAVGLSIDPKQIQIYNNIKSIGTHIVEIKQGNQIENIKIKVI